MQNEGPLGSAAMTSGFLSHFAFDPSAEDSPDLDSPWPRLLCEDDSRTGSGVNKDNEGSLSESEGGVSMFDDSSSTVFFNPDVGRKWTQVTWSPKEAVVAFGHADGIHLIEALPA
ncbi:unnamed protein product [Protopolystoma xenopodis]|uniref:Uncharacterized protein n=1 Tax=Protopolystoma xenopodis TaxID=117903 RepID=A0A3S5FFD6_9PLAT|nr:unnamed protein product [Protopolystoma xenopodis]